MSRSSDLSALVETIDSQLSASAQARAEAERLLSGTPYLAQVREQRAALIAKARERTVARAERDERIAANAAQRAARNRL